MLRLSSILLSTIMLPGALSFIQVNPIPQFDWKTAALLPNERGLAGVMSGVAGDMLLVTGGSNFPSAMPWDGGVKNYYGDSYIYQRFGDSLQYRGKFSLHSSLAYGAVSSTKEGIAIAGGENEKGLSDQAFLLNWNAQTKKVISRALPNLPYVVTNASMAIVDKKIYVVGGERAGEVSSGLLMLDMKHGAGWTSLSDVPIPLSHAVVLAIDKNIYVIGGRRKNPGSASSFYKSVYCFNTTKSAWSKKADLPVAISASTGIVMEKDHIAIFGGDTGETFRHTEELIAAISSETDPAKKKRLSEEKALLQANHPGFNRSILYYSVASDSWKTIGDLPFATPVTTTALHWQDNIIIAGGEIKAGVRTPNIMMAKIR